MADNININKNDITDVGLSDEVEKQLLEIIKETKYFKLQQDVYKFAVAIALAKNMYNTKWKFRDMEDRINTKWSVSGLDTDGSMKMIISLLAPDAGNTPYYYSQWLAMAGINYLHKELVDNTRSIIDVLNIEE